MIDKSELIKICNEYGIDYKNLIKNNSNVLEYGEEDNIIYILDFLKDKLNIDSKNIEKCPSILYFQIENVKDNYIFLKEKEINIKDVETCLHVLATDNIELKKTYEYIENEYGIEYLNKYTSILRVNVDRIKQIEEKFQKFNKVQVLQASFSKRSIEEIKKIVEVCSKNKIEITGSVFNKTAEEIEKIVEVCSKNKIEITGSVFMKTAEEIEKIVEVCSKNKIEITGNVFLKRAEEIEKIVEVCSKNKIEITGNVFKKTAEKLEENIEYIKEEFGSDYLVPLIVSKDIKTLKKVLPYLKERDCLEYVKVSASILSLTLEQIQEREKFIEQQGENIINEKGRFNSIFGLSKKNYEKKVKESNKISLENVKEFVKDVSTRDTLKAEKIYIESTKDKDNDKKKKG